MKQIIEGACFERFKARYMRAGRREKTEMLSHFSELIGCHRKHATRLMKGGEPGRPRNPRKRGPKSKYDFPDVVRGLKLLYKATDQMCSVLLKGAIPHWLPAIELKHGNFEPDVRAKLLKISPRTIERILCKHNIKFPKPKCGTKPGTILRTEIAVRQGIWDECRPGFMESDTVAHGGPSMHGQFVWSLTMTDIATHWTENRAIWHKAMRGVVSAVQDIEQTIPFDLLGFDCDNGGEFINNYLIRYFTIDHPRKNIIQFTRSREYEKNDNAHVEQRNWSHPRQLFHRERLDFYELTDVMNDIYRNEFSQLRNHFYPTLKLDRKMMVLSRYRRKYGDPVTPYDRVLASPHVSDAHKEKLQAVHLTLNPLALKQTLDAKLRKFWTLYNRLRRQSTVDPLNSPEALPNFRLTLG